MSQSSYLLHHDKRDFDKAEELYKKDLQTEPHRAATLFNYAAHLRWRGRMREARGMYGSVCIQEVVDTHIYLSRYLTEFYSRIESQYRYTQE